jgi:Fe-S cluster assembly iron-binding protein IscA
MRRFFPALVLLAGCTQPPPPQAVPVTSKPVIELSPNAESMLRQIAADQKVAEPWWVRLGLRWTPDPVIELHIDRQPPGPDDFTTEASGMNVVLPRELLTYLRGSRIELVMTKTAAGFDVTFPNQSPEEREASSQWLREQKAKRKTAAK